MRLSFPILAVLAATSACMTSTDEEDVASTESAIGGNAEVAVDVSPNDAAGKVDERIFGTNILYWVENDAELKDGKIRAELAGAGVKMLRFPGGAVANNYDWKTNSLDDPTIFPRSPDPVNDPIKRTNYTELLDFMSGVPGAEANFVVNIEGAYRESPVSRGKFLKRAADWVHEANIVNKRGVRYWEIGNEEYFPRRYGFSAPDYAAEVVAYANAMKAVDPSIRIGAVGPFSATEGSFIDRLTPSGLQKFESMTDDELDAKKDALGAGQEGLLDWLNGGVKVTPRAWWDVVAEKAGAKLDFIILHRYDATRAKGDFSKPVTLADTIDDIRKVVAKHKSGGFEVAMTEYNVTDDANLKANEHCTVMAEQLIHLMRSKVSFANFWPLQKGDSATSLLTPGGDARPRMEVFGDIAKHVGHHLLPSSVTKGKDVDVVATVDWKTNDSPVKRTMVIVNRARSGRTLHIKHLPGKIDRAVQYYAPDEKTGKLDKRTLDPQHSGNDWAFKMRALSITVLTTTGNQ